MRLSVEGRIAFAGDAARLVPGTQFAAAYFHVPFCRHKCHYCDFYSFVDTEERGAAFVARLEREIEAAREFIVSPLKTLFIGGGTPTMLAPGLLAQMLSTIRSKLAFEVGCEWTVEANPETVTDEVAGILASSGVNRVSLGAQSFNRELLHALERHHDPESVGRALDKLRRAGIGNINLDLIYGIPGSSLEQWREDLRATIALGPNHISAYGLVYEPNTPLTVKLRNGLVLRVAEELEAQQCEVAVECLADAGFARYEISNWATPGHECRHNLLYWENANWWAFGPSASGHADGVRWKNVPRLTDWLESGPLSPVVDVERLDGDSRAGEGFMLGLRLIRGIDRPRLAELLQMGSGGQRRREAIDRFAAASLLEWSGDRLRLTARGLMVADTVLSELV